jgi:hypothetical protein
VPAVQDVDPTGDNLGSNFILFTSGPPGSPLGLFLIEGNTVQMVSQLPSEQIDQLFFDAQTSAFTGSLLESYTPPPGWVISDGGMVATELFPLSAGSEFTGFVFL